MKLIGLMPARNEDWVLGISARVALMWCDSLVILDHASTDRTPQIIAELQAEYGSRVHAVQDTGTDWAEMTQRQGLLETARRENATHIAIVDADEILTANLVDGWIREAIAAMPWSNILQLPGYNLRGAADRYHLNGIWGDRWFSTAFMDHPRLHWAGDTFHHREPMGIPLRPAKLLNQGNGGVMHLWGASERRLKAKHALYKMTETLRWPNKRKPEIDRLYNLAFDPSEDRRFDQTWKFNAIPSTWWDAYAPLMKHLSVDSEPWQEAECQRLLALHGANRFAGLNLFGVCDHVAVT
jgi:glycosyltransferase involved in cell wall biosynthesis